MIAAKKILLLILLFLFVYYTRLNADILYLKNGRSIEGIINKEDDEDLELDVCAGTVKFKKSQIERIDRSSPEDSFAIRQEWERQKKRAQDALIRQSLEEEQKPKHIEFSQNAQSIILKAKLNNKVDAQLILDTGASLVMLRKNVANELGINLDNVKPDMKAQLADGRQVNAKFIVLESIRVEGVEANNVEASILLDEVGDGSFGDGLLGMSFLKRFNFKVDYRERKLILEKL